MCWEDCAFGLVLLVLLGLPIAAIIYTYNSAPKMDNIYSLEDNITLNGEFGLFTGDIDSDMYYFYYVKNDDGSLILKKINSQDVRIYLDSNNPYIVYGRGYGNFSYMHLPKNTIIKKINIDMK